MIAIVTALTSSDYVATVSSHFASRSQEEQEATRREREEAARERNRDREEKLSSVRAAEEGLKAELHLKIHQKQTEAARRHEEKLERVRSMSCYWLTSVNINNNIACQSL